MNQTNEPHPDFEIIFRADEMEPHATVAPEGEVNFQLINSTDAPHDFAVVKLEEDEREWRARDAPVTEDDVEAVTLIEAIPAHGGRAVTLPLEAGHYAIISNTPGDLLHASVAEITVQPADGTED